MTPIPPFEAGVVEQVCRVIGDLYSGTELTRLAEEIPLSRDPGEGRTKWRRLDSAVSANQANTGNGKGAALLE